jgi:hypothetical protein
MGSSIQRSCDTTYFVFTYVRSSRRQTVPRQHAACALRDAAVCGHVARLRDIPTSVFSHAQTHPQKSCRQPLDRYAIDAWLHLARTAHRISGSAAMALPTASAPPLRIAHVVGGSIKADGGPPSRGSGRLARPRSTPAAMALPTASVALRRLAYVRCRVRWRCPLPASAAVRAVRLLPSASAFRPAHRLPPQLWLPFPATENTSIDSTFRKTLL